MAPPLVLLHGFADTWRTWDLVLPALERHHDVLAPALAGHLGGPPIEGAATEEALLDAVEHAMDEAGFETAHLAGNSLGGYLALKLAARGRARTVVAFSPAGGWAQGDDSYKETLALQAEMLRTGTVPPGAVVANAEHIPAELLAHQLLGLARCQAGPALIEGALRTGWHLDAEHITCPVRIVWGTADKLTPWPKAAARYRTDWLPHADWVELAGVGHAPQLDAPLEAAQLILGTTTSTGSRGSR